MVTFSKNKMITKGCFLVLLPVMFISTSVQAQEVDDAEAAASAANPFAFVTKIEGQPNFTWKDQEARQVNVTSRLTIATPSAGLPFIKSKDPSKIYTVYRLEAPIISQTFPDNPELDATGLSDLTLLDVVVFRQNWGLLGIGPAVSIPVMKPEPISSRKWGAGFALAALITKKEGLQWGVLAQQFYTFAGAGEIANHSYMLFQPIFNVILKGGKFVQVSPVMNFNWTDQTYNVPIAISVGKAFSRSLSALIGPEYVVSGPNEGDFTFRFQLTGMFPPSKD